MKIKLTILFFFVAFGLYAQKQIQPYNYSISDKDGQTQTILIYATAEAINSITFTLKNAKNEVLMDVENEEIKFKVSPFTEVSFRAKLRKAILSIDTSEKDEKESLDFFTKKFEKSGEVVENVRNIYQFFNALVNTAFQYDTEPVAGILKYNTQLVISKKQIQGKDADLYFKKQAKFLRHSIIKAKDVDSIYLIPYKKLKPDEFMRDIFSNYPLLKEFYEYNLNTRRKKKHNARSKFKKHAIKNLGKLYNDYEIEKLLKQDFFKVYFYSKEDIITESGELKKIQANVKEIDFDLINKNEDIDSLELIISKIKQELLPYEKENKDLMKKLKTHLNAGDDLYYRYRSSSNKKNSTFQKKLDSLDKLIKSINENVQKLFEQYEPQIIKQDVIETNISYLDSIVQSQKIKKIALIDSIPSKNNLIRILQNKIDQLLSENRALIKKMPLWSFEVNNIEIDFNDGFIEHLTVTGNVKTPVIDESAIREALSRDPGFLFYFENLTNFDVLLKEFYKERIIKEILGDVLNKELKFINEYPIGFSSKTDFADLSNYTLYSFKGNEKTFFVPLDDVISLYVQKHQNDRLDFSPKDQVVKLPLDDVNKNNEIELKKESSSKILNANIFTDFNGLKESEPNGLVQIEVEKQIPLWTRRMELGIGRSSNIGFFNYAKFNLTWAKLAEEDRELQVSYAESFVNNETQVDKYVTYLDLIRYESASVGIDINIASIDFPLIKTRFELNAGAHFGRVNVVDDVFENTNDTIPKRVLDKKMNMIRLYPDVIVRFRPDERFGVYLRFRPFRVIVPDNEEFFSVSSAKNFEENRKLTKDWLHRFELGSFFTPSADSDNKFFFRYRYTNTSRWETNGYSEFQVGYSMYLKF